VHFPESDAEYLDERDTTPNLRREVDRDIFAINH